jgi:hypothetical protein
MAAKRKFSWVVGFIVLSNETLDLSTWSEIHFIYHRHTYALYIDYCKLTTTSMATLRIFEGLSEKFILRLTHKNVLN